MGLSLLVDHAQEAAHRHIAVHRRAVAPQRHRDVGQVIREVVDRLHGAGAHLDIAIDIEAHKAEGFTEQEIRTIGENARTLKFDPANLGFATE